AAREHPAAEHDVAVVHGEVADRSAPEQHDLVGEPLDEAARDLVRLRRGDDGRCELAEPDVANPPVVDGLADRADRRQPEVRADEADELRRLAAPVLRTCGMKEGLTAERLRPAPVAGLPAERRIARGAAG